ncbi:MAG: hypothetical protein EBZ49_00820 [Proteobacteria bacterium]|nr:hypothetical protein [Pseudomonadota bacterium]
MTQPVKGKAFVLDPATPSEIPNGSVFIDSTNLNQLSLKDTSGNVSVIGAGINQNLFVKQMQAGGSFGINQPLSKRPDGRVVLADSDGANTQQLIGYSLQISPGNNALVNVLLVGANILGAVNGLGFAPGDDVYISETGGYTNNVSSFSGDNDSIVKVGIADCSAGVSSSVATDLVVFPEVIAKP